MDGAPSPGRRSDRSVVLLALEAGGPGGIQRYLRRLAEAFDGMVASGDLGEWTGLTKGDPVGDVAGAPAGLVGTATGDLGFARRSTALVARRRPDVLVVGHPNLVPLLPVWRAVAPGARVVLIAYGRDIWQGGRGVRWLRRLIHEPVTISDHSADQMASRWSFPRDRIRLAAPPVDPAEAATSLAGRRIITVSRLSASSRGKHVAELIDAIARLRSRYDDVSLTVIGDGDDRPWLAARAEGQGVADRVRFLGAVADDELDAELRRSDVFALPSTQEGFGIVYLEAWARGLPVVAGDEAAAAQLIRHGVDGLVTRPEPAEVAAALGRLLADPEAARAMGEAGRARVRSEFAPRSFDRRWRDLVGTVRA